MTRASRFAAVCLCLAFFALGCEETPTTKAITIETVRMSVDGGPEHEVAFADIMKEKVTGKEVTLAFSVPRVEGPEPALRYDTWVSTGDLLRAELNGRELALTGRPLGVIPLPPDHENAEARLTFSGPRGHRLQYIQAGPQSVLVDESLAELTELIVGVGLAFVGAVLLAVGAVLFMVNAAKRTLLPLIHLGLFAAPVGVMVSAQAVGVRGALLASADVWRWLHGIAPFLYPIGILLFVDSLFPEASSKILQRVATGFAVGLALAVVCESAGVLPLETSKRVAFLSILAAIVPLGIRLARHARSSAPAKTILIGFCAMVLIASSDIYSGAMGGYNSLPIGQTTHWALLGFTTMLAITLGQVWAAQTRALVASEADLAAKVEALDQRGRKLDALNVELSRQVADRARAMSRAATLGMVAGGRGIDVDDVVDGRYHVKAVLGEGGMGKVFAVVRIVDDEPLALKVLRGGTDPSHSLRFIREAEIAATLRHPNLVGVVDVGVTAEGVLFLVMERVIGGSLEDTRPSFGEWPRAIERLRQVAEGLAFLHDAKFVHRDLKPANVLIEPSESGERIRISDFGIAKDNPGEDLGAADTFAVSDTLVSSDKPSELGPQLTATRSLLGTPRYMAPETVTTARAATAASDMFSFGVLAYELAFGGYPFEAPPILDALAGRASAKPFAPQSDAPSELVQLILDCLDDDPGRRPSAHACATALASISGVWERGDVPVVVDESSSDVLQLLQSRD